MKKLVVLALALFCASMTMNCGGYEYTTGKDCTYTRTCHGPNMCVSWDRGQTFQCSLVCTYNTDCTGRACVQLSNSGASVCAPSYYVW